MSNKRWDNDVAEFLFPKGLLIRIVVVVLLCSLVGLVIKIITLPEEKKQKELFKTLKEDVQAAIEENRFSEANELLKTYLKSYEETDETDEIAANILNSSIRGCWKGYGEWKTELQDSSGERYVYFYYPGEGDPLYSTEEDETYYLMFSDTELSSADQVIDACASDSKLCFLLASVKLKNYDTYNNSGYMIFYCYEPSEGTSPNIAFDFHDEYFFKNDTAEIRYYYFNEDTLKTEKVYRVALERMTSQEN